MQRYVAALAANPPQGEQPLPPDAKTLGMNDVQTLLQMIQKLTQAGDRQQAAQLLAMLQSMLENMHMSQGQGGQGGQGRSQQDKALNDAIQKYGGLMAQQRSLLDKTFRQRRGQADPKDGGAQGLQKQQQDLQKQLQDSLKGMDGKSAEKLREAGKAMARRKPRWARRIWRMPAAPRTRRWKRCARGRRRWRRPRRADNSRRAGPRAAASRRLASRASRFPAPPTWPGRAKFCRNCAAAPPR